MFTTQHTTLYEAFTSDTKHTHIHSAHAHTSRELIVSYGTFTKATRTRYSQYILD